MIEDFHFDVYVVPTLLQDGLATGRWPPDRWLVPCSHGVLFPIVAGRDDLPTGPSAIITYHTLALPH